MKFNFLALSFIFFLSHQSAAVADRKTPVDFQKIYGSVDLSKAKTFIPPSYSGQTALGYSDTTFAVPRGMEERVSFWLDIYTKYTTDQGILHDSKYVHLVYESIDFGDIMTNESLDTYQKRKARRKRVKDAKKKIKDRLSRLSRLKSSAGLEGEDLRYWYLFQKVEDKNKFNDARKKNRLRFQLGQKNRMIEGIFHSGKYIRQMEDIFREANLPIELTRMVYVESSFNPKARSKVGASGIWQFMRRTARRYMRMDWSVDERNDPLTATRSAAKKLKNNYKMLESWPLAVTGYNHGPSGVRRMVKRYGTKDIVELTDQRRGRFRFASANFYATFLAALEAEKNAEKYYGKEIKTAPPLVGKEINLQKRLSHKSLLKWFDGDMEKAKEFNLHIRNRVWQGHSLIKKRNFIRVPVEKYEFAMNELKTMKPAQGPVASGEYHRVQRGETLSEIAQRFGVRISALKEINDISNPRRLRAGQKLMIPQ